MDIPVETSQLDTGTVQNADFNGFHFDRVDNSFFDVSADSTVDQSAPRLVLSTSRSSQTITTELVFIDSNVPSLEELLNDLRQSTSAEIELSVFVLDAQRDGIAQISHVLAARDGVDAVHIVSHGNDGAVKLGNVWLDIDTIDVYAGQIAGWNNSLQDGADLLIYGCELVASEDGRALTEAMGALCDCDVAASVDDTGYAPRGGDWDLEYAVGRIKASVAFSSDVQQNWTGLLATPTDPTEFRVNPNAATTQATALPSTEAVASDASGRFVVVWEGEDSDFTGVYARLYDADGTPLTGEILVNTYRG